MYSLNYITVMYVIMVGCMLDMVDQNKHNVDHNQLGSGLALVSFDRVDC